MVTLQQAHDKDASYFGDRGDWLIVYAKTRDASILDRANWATVIERLDSTSNDWAVESSSHWAVGYIEFIIVAPHGTYKDMPEIVRSELEDYPVLDDERFSEYESDATEALWREMSMKERVDMLSERGDSIFAARAESAGELYDRAERTFYHVQLLVTA